MGNSCPFDFYLDQDAKVIFYTISISQVLCYKNTVTVYCDKEEFFMSGKCINSMWIWFVSKQNDVMD